MSGKVLNYFAGGNTAKGFYSLFDSVLDGLGRLFILKGGPGTGKSVLMKTIGEHIREKGYDIEYLHCASDTSSIDGVIIPVFQIGIVDGTAPHIIEPSAPGVIDDYVNLDVALDREKLIIHKEDILKLGDVVSAKFKLAYETFAEALQAHDELENIYISNMDFDEANKLTDELIALFFQTESIEKQAKVVHRFLGAATPIGAVDFIPNLTEGIAKRYLIKGRSGSGKSTILKKIAAAGEAKGFDIEVYHCGFDPTSVDMIIVREKGIAIFDSTLPHEYFPERDTDEIVDIYKRCITPGTDEMFAAEIERTRNAYKKKMKEATTYLAEAKAVRDQLEAYYIAAMDFAKVDEIRESILAEIEKLMGE
ncbi:hypothetical protein GN156_14410 [bacterium LRH843]|nr:hypothetical protein [bacterium LRH843]